MNTKFTFNQNLLRLIPASLFSLVTLMSFMVFVPAAIAQTPYNEPFQIDRAPLPAPAYPQSVLARGWSQGKFGTSTSSINVWDVMNSALSGNANVPAPADTFMRFQSWSIPSNEASFIATKRLDMRNNVAGISFDFKLYRENGFSGNADRIEVYYNDSAFVDPANPSQTLLADVGGNTVLHRSRSLTPAGAAADGWYTYTYNLPGGAPYNTSNFYIMIVATSAFGNNIYIDDFNIGTWPATQNYTASSAFVVSQNTATTAPSATNQQIIGLKMTVDGALTPRTLSNMQFNTNGCSNPVTDIANAKLYFTGGTPLFSTANAILMGTYIDPHATNFAFLTALSPPNYIAPSRINFNGLDHGDNYFWLTYDIKPGATSGNFVDGEWIGFSISGVGGVLPTTQTLPGNRLIDVVYCSPSYSVGTAWANYQTNDFIQSVQLLGENIPAGGINTDLYNNHNYINAYAGPQCTGLPRLCPFQSHPPDYELYNFPSPAYSVPNTTTQVIANGTTQYPITLKVGTYGSGNAIAAWIDYTGDGTFNNWFDNIQKIVTGASGATTITVAGGVYTTGLRHNYGLNIGMTVYGTGVAAGARVTNIVGNVVTLNLANTGAVNSAVEFRNENAPFLFGEKVAQSGPLTNLQALSTSFKAPVWASSSAGKRRIRVREVWINYNIHPCNTATYGETEDFPITIVPDCPVFPTYKTWLGLTSDWSDPSNWCPVGAPVAGIASPFPNLRFPGGPTGGTYTYTKAIISAGVQARANKFRVETNDTVFINAPSASNLIMTDSLKIDSPNSTIEITSAFADSAQVENGTLPNLANVPLKSALKARSGWVFTEAELTAKGLQNGDIINKVKIHVKRGSNGNPYRNLKLKYYYATVAGNFGGAMWPAVNGLPAAPVTVFSGDINASAFVPVAGNWGTIELTLTNGGIVYSNDGRKLILDLSYDQGASPLTGVANLSGFNEDSRFTQTQSNVYYMSYSSNSLAPTVPGAETMLYNYATVTKNSPTTVTNLSNVITVPNVTNLFVGMQVTSPAAIAGRIITAINVPGPNQITLDGNATNNSTANIIFRQHTSAYAGIQRANLTFEFERPYIKYPIFVAGSWKNDGDFIAGNSIVDMNGTALQRIEGASVTEFFDLKINNNSHVILNQDVVIADSLRLENGRFKLNNRLASLTNTALTALTRSNGLIQSETDVLATNVAPFGRFRWNMDNITGVRVIPFVNAAGTSIFFDYEPTAGTHDVIFSTYATAVTNLNIPSPVVTNIYGFNGTGWNSDGSALVDRFYMIDNSAGVAPTAHMTFRYSLGERAATNLTGAAQMRAQRWLNDSTRWEFPYQPNQTYSILPSDQVRILDYAGFSGNTWWVIVGQTTPLPVTLLDFKAVPFKDKVQLKWSTASEINSSHFDVERTLDNEDFSFIGRVQSRGPSTNKLDYETWDMNPVEGVQYYYLRQHDVDGRMESFGPVSAKFSNQMFDIVTATVSSTEMGLEVVFSYDSNEPYSYRIIDMLGRVVVAKDKNPAEPGMNVIDIDAKLSQGAYQIILQNSTKTVSRKFFY